MRNAPDESHESALLATQCARAVHKDQPLQNGGRRESRMPKRTRSLVCKSKKHTSVVTTGSPVTPGLPCAMVLTVSFVLSPVIGYSIHTF